MKEQRPFKIGDRVRLKPVYGSEQIPQVGIVAKAAPFGIGQVLQINGRWILAGYYEKADAA